MLMINIKQTLGSLLVIGKRVLRIIMLYPLFQNGFYGFSGGCEIYSRSYWSGGLLVFHNKILVNKEVI